MDKRLLKSLTTAKARYENAIALNKVKLHVVDTMLETIAKEEVEASPVVGDTGAKPPAFMESAKKKLSQQV